MEDGDNNHTEVLSKINADDKSEGSSQLPDMANYPDLEVTVIKNKSSTETATATGTKVNGESTPSQDDEADSDKEDEESSDEDVLVIDEERRSQKVHASNASRKRLLSPSSRADFKGFKKRMLRQSTEVLKTVNEYILAAQLGESEMKANEAKCDKVDESISQGELDSIEANTKNIKDDTEIAKSGDNETPTSNDHKSNLNQIPVDAINEDIDNDSTQINPPDPKPRKLTINKIKTTGKKTNKKTPSPKLTEYAQYLGLQPTVKFKCYKCSDSSFPSMSALNEHQQQCLVQPEPSASKPETSSQPSPQPATAPAPSSTNFRVTRKVYLCSACGTYYENWNLFLHMREVHRRFICLYCLGMFSLVEKLSQHLVAKHNCVPNQYFSAEEYLSAYKEACFIMCCHCERVFTEQDNFFDHICMEKATTNPDKACWSCGSKGTTPHLPLCKASIELPSTSNQKSNKLLNQKMNQKQIKSTKKTPFTNIEHVTADSPSNSKPLSPRLESEQTCDIANLCTVDMDSTTLNSEPMSPTRTPGEMSPAVTEEQKGTEAGTDAGTEASTEAGTEADTEAEKDPVEPSPSPEAPAVEEDKQEVMEKTTEVEKITPSIPEIAPTEVSESENENQQSEPECDKIESESIHSDTKSPELSDNNESGDIENEKETQSDHESDKDAESDHSVMETKTNDTNEIVKESDNSVDMPMDVSDSDRNINVSETEMDVDNSETEKPEEVRRVPKVTLKLPPPGTRFSDNESDDSEKLTMEVEENESEQEYDESQELSSKETEQKVNGIDSEREKSPSPEREIDGYPIAGDDISIVELELEQPLDKFTTENLIKTCLNATVPTCIYCNHARKIVVNGRQLGLHVIAEHRFSATVNSITAEELIPHNFVMRIRDGLNELDDRYFNLEIEEKYEPPSDITFKREYECFQCRYITTIHKELYLHNRKMHAKSVLLCIICKSNFYTYSELICHLCPGNYALNNEMKFRCCMCDIADLPSAFRLMVHLRKRHHTCDVCLEGCQNQSRLSNHVWKHKLHHLCYRCGIAYRNKPDITKHLFWKHGTESVLCKKCLQKKWPHVYHFCIPPTAFACEECNLSFSRAVYLKVHKRLHSNERKHSCTEEGCSESFISKKLLLKHEKRHREPDPVPEKPEIMNGELTLENEPVKPESLEKEILNEIKETTEEKPSEEEEKKQKIPDIYDLPALNLSESDSDDSEEEAPKPPVTEEPVKEEPTEPIKSPQITEPTEEEPKPVPILDGIWDNFKQYQATIEKRDLGDNKEDEKEGENEVKDEKEVVDKPAEVEIKVEPVAEEIKPNLEVIMFDHDYCLPQNEDKKDETSEMDHDYCSMSKTEGLTQEAKPQEEKKKSKKKKTSSSSDSSSDSDSSSCTCGSNCSCSSSSGSSSSSSSSSDSDSSSSEGKRRIAARKERRKERAKRKKESETSQATNTSAVDVVATEDLPPPIIELPIEESDLDTDETETDEDFYDEHPQRLANKILEEKRNQLMLLAGVTPPVNNGVLECSRPSTPSIPEEVHTKKKQKSKKRKKKSRSSTPKQDTHIPTYNHQQSPLAQTPITPIPILVQRPVIPSPIHNPPVIPMPRIETPKQIQTTGSGSETDSNVRSSKRRRVPNKFYGYSSDDENAEKPPAPPILKWRRSDLPSTPTQHVTASPKYVPPITIKNIPSPAPVIEPIQAPIIHHTEIQDSDSETEVQPRKSSSESSDEHNDDSDSDGQLHISQPQFPPVPQVQRTNENLYCYCQCPYDEVSEMIACDGRDCAIEWFHFECVGIMVPPKGKWFCPDCRKKTNLRNDYIQT